MEDENANAQVDAFLRILYVRFGVHESDIKQWIQYMPAVIDAHQRSVRYGEMVAKTLIGSLIVSIVGGLFGGLGYAAVHFIQSIK